MDAAASSCQLCRFYDKAHKLDVLDFFKAQAVHPDAVPDAVFRCIGRTVWADIGEHLSQMQECEKAQKRCTCLTAQLWLSDDRSKWVKPEDMANTCMLRGCHTMCSRMLTRTGMKRQLQRKWHQYLVLAQAPLL